MTLRRGFTGGREQSAIAAIAKDIRRMELRKGGRLPLTSAQRYKMILDRRVEMQRAKASMNPQSTFMLKGAKGLPAGQMSKKAEMALKEIARKKAAREAKEMRQMVVVKPRWYGNVGHINAKGVVYDHVNNITLRVDVKTGKIKTAGGWTVGKYKPKSGWHDGWMQSWIKKHSPYWIKMQQIELQRQIAAMQQLQNQGMVTVHGMPIEQQIQHLIDSYGNLVPVHDMYGNATNDPMGVSGGPNYPGGRGNLGVTVHGVQSNNVWGTFGDNVHGGFSDNIWGTTYNNVWGGIGDAGSFWGNRATPGRRIWGSASGKNHLKKWGGMLMAKLGFGGDGTRNRMRGRMVGAPRPTSGRASGRR